jgi:syntaxin 5
VRVTARLGVSGWWGCGGVLTLDLTGAASALLHKQAAESSQAPPLGADSAAASGKAHSEQVVTRLKSQLLDTTKEFQGMLQVRTQSMKVQQDRRGHFGQPRTLHLTPPSHPVAPAPASPAVAFGGQPFSAAPAAAAGSHASAAEGGPATAYASPGASTADSLHMRRASPAAASQQSHVQLPQPAQHQLQQQQQQQLIPAGGAYLEQRANAVSDIESHISELGTIFSRLSALVAEQGQMVERIDDDVEAAHEHVQSGQQQLQRYWSGLSSNRALTAKMFGVLISTILIFLFFLA